MSEEAVTTVVLKPGGFLDHAVRDIAPQLIAEEEEIRRIEPLILQIMREDAGPAENKD